MVGVRGTLDTDGLVGILLLLVVVWLALEVFGELLGMLPGPFALLRPLVGLVVLALLVLYLLGRL